MEIDEKESGKNSLKTFLDVDFPLLIAFRDKAPGTFIHSKNVKELMEGISLELDLDIDKMLVAAMYHDIGKMNFPEFFSENQEISENIHDSLDPIISYYLITRHVGDSVLTMMKYNIPQCILDIISQHHGNTILRGFYAKAKKINKKAVEDNYRYKCDTPKSTEAAILMICDSVEATARSKFNEGILKDLKSKENVVNTTIQRLENDGQLDDMKVGQIKLIKKALITQLSNIYHKREKYEDEEQSDL